MKVAPSIIGAFALLLCANVSFAYVVDNQATNLDAQTIVASSDLVFDSIFNDTNLAQDFKRKELIDAIDNQTLLCVNRYVQKYNDSLHVFGSDIRQCANLTKSELQKYFGRHNVRHFKDQFRHRMRNCSKLHVPKEIYDCYVDTISITVYEIKYIIVDQYIKDKRCFSNALYHLTKKLTNATEEFDKCLLENKPWRPVPPVNGTTEAPGTTGGSRPPWTGGTRPPGTGGTRPPWTGGTRPPGTGGTRPPGTGGTRPPGTGGTRPPWTGGTSPPGTGGTRPPWTGGTHPPWTGGTSPPWTGGTRPPWTGGTRPPWTGGTSPPWTGGTRPPWTGGTRPPWTGGTRPPWTGGTRPPWTGGTHPQWNTTGWTSTGGWNRTTVPWTSPPQWNTTGWTNTGGWNRTTVPWNSSPLWNTTLPPTTTSPPETTLDWWHKFLNKIENIL